MTRVLDTHQCGLGSSLVPSVIYGLSLLLVLVLAARVFLRILSFQPTLQILNIRSTIKLHFITGLESSPVFSTRVNIITFTFKVTRSK